MDYLHQFLFGIYPYIAAAVFLLGSLARFERDQYTWRSESSQMLRTGALRLGSNLFHIGIIGLFFGHMVGNRTDMAIGVATADDHAVGDARLAADIDNGDVATFQIVNFIRDEIV